MRRAAHPAPVAGARQRPARAQRGLSPRRRTPGAPRMRVRTLPASLTPTASPAPARESVMTLPPGLRRNVRTGGPAPAIKAAAGGGRHCAAEQAAAVAACGPAVPLPAPSRRLSLSLFLSPSLSSPFSFFSSPSPFPSPPPPPFRRGHAARLYRPPELPRPGEGHPALLQRLWPPARGRPQKRVSAVPRPKGRHRPADAPRPPFAVPGVGRAAPAALFPPPRPPPCRRPLPPALPRGAGLKMAAARGGAGALRRGWLLLSRLGRRGPPCPGKRGRAADGALLLPPVTASWSSRTPETPTMPFTS